MIWRLGTVGQGYARARHKFWGGRAMAGENETVKTVDATAGTQVNGLIGVILC
jgi:hypothetical protein